MRVFHGEINYYLTRYSHLQETQQFNFKRCPICPEKMKPIQILLSSPISKKIKIDELCSKIFIFIDKLFPVISRFDTDAAVGLHPLPLVCEISDHGFLCCFYCQPASIFKLR